jgi:2',3'-cyclic-nucleotide 2'-phosphodiesterase/3'-nucleotidase/5'-nucleotidase
LVYDISWPLAPKLVQYVTTREFSTEEEEEQQTGDIAPEGMVFISAADSPNGSPLLVVANEVSGTTTVYQIQTVEF